MKAAADMMKLEERIRAKTCEYGLKLYAESLQRVADETPRVGSDGRRLTQGRMQDAQVRTPYGTVPVRVFCGRCVATGRFEVPFKEAYCRGSRFAMTPLLERHVAVTACETGSFEKCGRLCAEWGCHVSDDKAMDLVRDLGESCLDSDLPPLCRDAAGTEDVLIVSLDGWEGRFRGERWGEKEECRKGHVDWHDIKSAVMYKLSQVADISAGRRTIVTKHILCVPPGTTPEAFAKKVEREAERMGMLRAAKVYFIMDGATYLWNLFDVCFSFYARGTLDYYHAVQHLAALADALFAGEKDPGPRKEWLDGQCRELKALGPKTLLETIRAIDWKSIRKREAKKTAKREAAYFLSHEDHTDYGGNAALGVPIGSGAMESQCSQNQNRFKRRGQFWSDEGFAAFIEVYARYTNGELKYCFSRRKAA